MGNEKAVDENQYLLFPVADLPDEKIVTLNKAKTSAGHVTTFYFCAHIDGDDVRAELSCPTSFENGFFGSFVERIYIVGGDTPLDETSKRKPTGDGDSEYDIPVKLKKHT